jgi:hypothetical protein
MLEVMLTFFGMLAQGAGLTLIKSPGRLDESDHMLKFVRSCRVKGRANLNLDEIRRRVLRTTDGRDESDLYSIFDVSGQARVGDIGGSFSGLVDVPFDALAIGGPTHSSYNDHVLALVPKIHEDAQANAEFFAHARADILALLGEIDRLARNGDAEPLIS